MKITIYELLGLIKDGKAPKKIKYENILWRYYNLNDYEDYTDEEKGLFCDYINNNYYIQDLLNDELEIIEEDKKIEKLTFENTFKGNSDMEVQEILVNKINELIEEIKKLKESK